MNFTQNEKISQVTNETLEVGIDISDEKENRELAKSEIRTSGTTAILASSFLIH